MKRWRSRAAAIFAAAIPCLAQADDAELLRRIEILERRVTELDAELSRRDSVTERTVDLESARGPAAEAAESRTVAQEIQRVRADADGLDLSEWTRRVRLGANAELGYFWGENDSVLDDLDFAVWDARFFVDAELGEDVRVGDTVLVRNAGFSFEWNLVRLGVLTNDVGSLYVELQGLLESPWANVQVGRFQIPVGEAYLGYGKGEAERPFITHAVSDAWFWDEGVKLYGSGPNGRIGYVASVTDGDNSFNFDSDSDKQVTLKLFAEPTSWLHLSVSGLRSGTLGSSTRPANGAFWLGETWARAFGSGSPVPNYVDGVVAPDGPNVLRDTYFAGGDAILRHPRWGQLWFSYGAFWIDSKGDGGAYDTMLHAWLAELTLEGRLASETLEPFYLALRASGLGGYDDDLGYLLDVRYTGSLGYNMRSLNQYSAAIGWRMTRWLRMVAEYSHVDIDMVRGVSSAMRSDAMDADSAAVEFKVDF